MATQANHGFSPDKVAEFKDAYDLWNSDGDDKLDVAELTTALKSLGAFDENAIETILNEVDSNKDGNVDFNEFMNAVWNFQQRGDATSFGKLVNKQMELIGIQTASGGLHSYATEEISAFASHLNYVLGDDPDLDYLMPIATEGEDLFHKVKDGVLIAKFINMIEADAIDWRVVNFKKGGGLNQFKIIENHSLNLATAKAIGLRIFNVSPEDLRDADKNPTLVLGFMWQAVKMQLLGSINLKSHPELIRLKQGDEELNDLLALPPEEILKRWVNYHLEKQNYPTRIRNFGGDIKDGKVYTVLLKSIDPKQQCTDDALNWDNNRRCNEVIKGANSIGAKPFIKASDILAGNEKLNLAFTAQLFNTCPGLEAAELNADEEKELAELAGLMDDDDGDNREERAFRMWMNTLGLGDDTYITNLFEDISNGITLLKVIDKIEPGIVNWKKVQRGKMKFHNTINCNEAILCGKQMKLILVGIQGSDIHDKNKKLILGFTWQLMRYHMLKFLASLANDYGRQITDADIVEWCNTSISNSGKKGSINSFGDQSLSTGVYFVNLLASVVPDIVDWTLVTEGVTDDDKLLNARYAISLARKIGCVIFLLPEDIVEVRSKMCLTFGAAVMAQALSKGGH